MLQFLASIFLGPPLTPIGRKFVGNPHVNLLAKAFVYAWLLQVAISFGPMVGDFRQIFFALANPAFDYNLLNSAFWKAALAGVAIVSDNPYDPEPSSNPSATTTLTQLPPPKNP
jgi:hypothetical protein